MDETTKDLEIASSMKSKRGEPTWELATLYPLQGEWTEETYLALSYEGKVELSDGCLEFLPPTMLYHQRLVEFMFLALQDFVDARRLGEVLFDPLPIRLWPGKLRDPDISFFQPGRIRDPHRQPDGADLVVEVVSFGEDGRERDVVTKRLEYAQARIQEYWIIDPQEQHITVLALDGTAYREHGVFAPGDRATSVLLSGFEVAVADVFAAGNSLTPGS